jgi:hypothetical protein
LTVPHFLILAGGSRLTIDYDVLGNAAESRVEAPGERAISVSPNPFNGLTRIQLSAPFERMSVVDIRGVRVADFASKGARFVWDAGHCAAGIYMICVKDKSGKVMMKKITLLK